MSQAGALFWKIKVLNMLTLYASPRACSLAPHIALYEARADFNLELVPISEGAHLTEEYSKINPRRRVPALKTDWGVLTEAGAILFYIGEQYPDANLLPPPRSRERARLMEMASWLTASLHATGYGALWRPGRFHPDPKSIGPAIEEMGRQTIQSANQEIENAIAGKFVLGDQYTVLDPYLYVFFRWADRIGLDMRSQYPRWSKWAHRMEKREAVKAALKAEGLELFSE